jgi:hypothetical protein
MKKKTIKRNGTNQSYGQVSTPNATSQQLPLPKDKHNKYYTNNFNGYY